MVSPCARRRAREKYHELKKQGLCVSCKQKSIPDKIHCKPCNIKNKESQRVNRDIK